MRIPVTSDVIETIRRASAIAHPEEACGLLFGTGGRITLAVPARNVHPRPQTHFEIDPQTLIDAYREERRGGLEVIGYYHSHPVGAPCPSPVDADQAAGDGKVWAIISQGDIRLWKSTPEGFSPLSMGVIDG